MHLRFHQESRASLSGRWSPLLGVHWQITVLLINTMWYSSSQLLSNLPFLTWGLNCGLSLLSPWNTCASESPFSLVCPGSRSQKTWPRVPSLYIWLVHRCPTASFFSQYPHHLLSGKFPDFSPVWKGTYVSILSTLLWLGSLCGLQPYAWLCAMSLSRRRSWQPVVTLLC